MLSWVIAIILSIVLANPVLAADIPQASDVVVMYEFGDNEAQAKYNYVFAVNDDPTIYPCNLNRCSMVPFRTLSNVTLTIYKLPAGFPRPITINNQAKLKEYAQQAEHTYKIEGIATNWDATADGRPYQVVEIFADGHSTLNKANFIKADPTAVEAVQGSSRKKWWLMGLSSIVIIGGGAGIWWWRKARLHS